jgi:FkbM family methyltransferase
MSTAPRPAPVLSTRRLFTALLPVLDIDTVCDVGSKDGTDALRFRRQLPAAQVIAFEASPRNFELMRADAALTAGAVRTESFAVTDFDGVADFFVVRAEHPIEHARRGMSSLYRRVAEIDLERVVSVPTIRLDTYLGSTAPAVSRCALWIDAEGKAFEVIAGARGVLERIQLLHVEVETRPLIGAAQKTYADVRRQLENAGFKELATDHASSGKQFNTLFMRATQPQHILLEVRRRLLRARLRRRLSNVVYHLLPGPVRGYLAGRYGIRGSIG